MPRQAARRGVVQHRAFPPAPRRRHRRARRSARPGQRLGASEAHGRGRGMRFCAAKASTRRTARSCLGADQGQARLPAFDQAAAARGKDGDDECRSSRGMSAIALKHRRARQRGSRSGAFARGWSVARCRPPRKTHLAGELRRPRAWALPVACVPPDLVPGRGLAFEECRRKAAFGAQPKAPLMVLAGRGKSATTSPKWRRKSRHMPPRTKRGVADIRVARSTNRA